MAVLGDAAAVAGLFADEVFFDQIVHCLLNSDLIKIHHRLAVAPLVAGVGERIERERVLLRRGDLLFEETADDPGFVEREFDGHGETLLGRGIAPAPNLGRNGRALICFGTAWDSTSRRPTTGASAARWRPDQSPVRSSSAISASSASWAQLRARLEGLMAKPPSLSISQAWQLSARKMRRPSLMTRRFSFGSSTGKTTSMRRKKL